MATSDYETPSYVTEGMEVFIPWDGKQPNAGPGRGLRCKVLIAAGNAARVVNAEYGVDRWVPIYDLLVRRR